MNRIPVYFMPGMAASPEIFEKIKLPEEAFEVFFLEWVLPNKGESLQSYAKRMAATIPHQEIVLIGVSFGGVLIQEMADYLSIRRLIIISSVKSTRELPKRFSVAKKTKAYKLLPTGLLKDVEKLVKYAFGESLKRKLRLYEKYLHMRNTTYLDWAIEQMVCWECSEVNPNVVHIHGDADEVFPLRNISNAIVVKGGTHAMILAKYRWFNTHLPGIILDNS